MKQPELYERFRALHEREGGFIMPNAWDGVSALLLKQAGFEALGTSSAAIASAMGRLDGRHAVTREEHLANALNYVANNPVRAGLCSHASEWPWSSYPTGADAGV